MPRRRAPVVPDDSLYPKYLRPQCYAVLLKKTRQRLDNKEPIPYWTMAHIRARMRKIPGCDMGAAAGGGRRRTNRAGRADTQQTAPSVSGLSQLSLMRNLRNLRNGRRALQSPNRDPLDEYAAGLRTNSTGNSGSLLRRLLGSSGANNTANSGGGSQRTRSAPGQGTGGRQSGDNTAGTGNGSSREKEERARQTKEARRARMNTRKRKTMNRMAARRLVPPLGPNRTAGPPPRQGSPGPSSLTNNQLRALLNNINNQPLTEAELASFRARSPGLPNNSFNNNMDLVFGSTPKRARSNTPRLTEAQVQDILDLQNDPFDRGMTQIAANTAQQQQQQAKRARRARKSKLQAKRARATQNVNAPQAKRRRSTPAAATNGRRQ